MSENRKNIAVALLSFLLITSAISANLIKVLATRWPF